MRPNDAGFNLLLGKLNDFGGDYIRAEKVNAFIGRIQEKVRAVDSTDQE